MDPLSRHFAKGLNRVLTYAVTVLCAADRLRRDRYVKKHLTAIGNSFGIIIDKPILDLLNIDKNTPLEVKTDGQGLIIRPVYDDSHGEPERPKKGELTLGKSHLTGIPPIVDDQAHASEEPTAAPPEAARPEPPSSNGDPANPEIVVLLRNEPVMRMPLGDQQEWMLGRDKTCDIHLDDRALSRQHARMERRGASLWVQDLGSANGTFVNGEEIKTATRLHGGDIIGVGHYRIHLEGLAEAAADTPVLTLNGPEGQHRFALVGEQVVIGRAQTCDISIGHKSISK
jgi:antitoxin component of MazEF toxin-antitoxin module